MDSAVSPNNSTTAQDTMIALGAPDVAPPETGTLEYSQGAARVTGSIGPFDLGASYYFGFMSEPGYEFTTVFTGTNPLDPSRNRGFRQ